MQNSDTIRGKIRLKNKIFYVTGNSNTEINAENVKKIHSTNYKGTSVLMYILQLYNQSLTDLEMGWVNVSAKDMVMILEEVLFSQKIN